MAQGSTSVLTKNLKNFMTGVVGLATGASPAFATWKKMYDRQRQFAPKEFVDQHETFSEDYHRRFHAQPHNFWVDKELSTVVSQKELASFMQYKTDFWRILHVGAALPILGLYALPLSVLWLGNNIWVPSTFNKDAAELKQWRECVDLYRYRFAPTFLTDTKWFFDMHVAPPTAQQERAWDELFEKNDVRRNPEIVRQVAPMYNRFIKLELIKRKSLRHLCRAMAFPTFPFWGRLCQGTRLRDYWMLAFNEDYMVIRDKLHETMSDEELFDYAWRRFLAPVDKNLTREQLLERVTDYHTFLGKEFMETGNAPNLVVLCNYVLGYYNEPAFLEEDISELDKNDYDHLASWGKDAFLRRLEFENGPLRDQVEAHSQRLLEQRAAKAAESK